MTELVAWLKANPGKATVGIAGVGGGGDVVISIRTRVETRHIARHGHLGDFPFDILADQIREDRDVTFSFYIRVEIPNGGDGQQDRFVMRRSDPGGQRRCTRHHPGD